MSAIGIAVRALAAAALTLASMPGAMGQTTPPAAAPAAALAAQLRAGGYVIVMRHAHAPADPPPAGLADPANTNDERQLDAAGRESASAMGKAMHRLGIPIGEVWSSPTYRARQTILLAGLPAPHLADELGDKGHSMQAAGSDQGAWLRARANQPPARGSDTLIVTHQPNMAAAFGKQADGLTDGEALVFRPDALGPPIFIGKIPIGDWPVLAGKPDLR